jgi:uncharacterized protein (TIGR01777 family)
MKKNVLITGGTGFIGKHLTDLLVLKGYSVLILSRNVKQNSSDVTYFKWDISKKYIDERSVLKADYIIHLAGENIAESRWTTKRKLAIVNSREQPIQLLYATLIKHNKKIDAFVSASGVGIYGAVNGPEICTENTTPANDFLGTTCQKWEAAADKISALQIRTVKIRTGLVLGNAEGFLKKLVPIFKLKLGSALGDGTQYMPWIHIDDLCNIYLEALCNSNMEGAYNAAIHDETDNTLFSKTLAQVFGYTIWLPNVPVFILQLIMGEMSEIILKGRRVSSDKIEKLGFQFQFKNLKIALKDCLME